MANLERIVDRYWRALERLPAPPGKDKPTPEQRVDHALALVQRGERAHAAMTAIDGLLRSPFDQLSPFEARLALLAVHGLTVPEIATAAKASFWTVKDALARACVRVGVVRHRDLAGHVLAEIRREIDEYNLAE